MQGQLISRRSFIGAAAGAAMAFAGLGLVGCGSSNSGDAASGSAGAALSGTGWLFCGGAACGLVYFLALFALGNDGVREVRAALRAPGKIGAGRA